MKAKMDPEAMKEFALNHAEKAIFAIFVLVFCGMIWSSALYLKGISMKPEELTQMSTRAQARIDETRVVTIPIEDYSKLAVVATEPTDPKYLQLSVLWSSPLWQDRKKREQPLVFPVEDVRVVSGRGKVPYNAPKTPGTTLDDEEGMTPRGPSQGAYYNIVLAGIPYKKQKDAYEAALGMPVPGARDANKLDEPTYYRYEMQRAEVPENWDGNSANLKWVDFKVGLTGGLFAENYRIIETMSPSTSGYTDNLGLNMTSRETLEDEKTYVPPRLMRRDERARSTARRGDVVADERGLVPDTRLTLMNPLPQLMSSGPSGGNVDWITTLTFPNGIKIGEPKRAKPRGGKTPEAEEDAPVERSLFGDEETMSPTRSGMQEPLKGTRLFSFVDYTVEPGKTYVYRIKLELHNPNYLFQPTQLVANEEITKARYLETKWSEISKPATTGANISILSAGSDTLTIDKKPAVFPALMLVQFDMNTGDERACRFNKIGMWKEDPSEKSLTSKEKQRLAQERKDLNLPFLNGRLLNLRADDSLMKSLAGSSQSYGSSSARQTAIMQDFPTNYVLLDVKLRKKEVVPEMRERDQEPDLKSHHWDYSAIYAPARVLLLEMEPGGKTLRMDIQSEVDDYEEVYARDTDPQRYSSSIEPTPSPTTGTGTRTPPRRGTAAPTKSLLDR